MCWRGALSQSSDECNQAKKCGECISNANCFWCSEADDKDIGAKCFTKSANNDIYEQCSNKEDPENDLAIIQDEKINLGEILIWNLKYE